MKQSKPSGKDVLFNRVVFVLSVIGVVIAIYVTQSFLRQSPIVCVTSGCELVRKHPASYLFGTIPVPSVGLIGYAVLAALAFLRTTLDPKRSQLALRGMLGMAAFGAAFVTWFTYTELFIIKGICTWCAISAVNMYVILSLVVRSYVISTKNTTA